MCPRSEGVVERPRRNLQLGRTGGEHPLRRCRLHQTLQEHVRPLNREPGATGGSRIIVTLTLLLASAGPTNGFLAYSCGNLRSTVAGYALAPREGCWMRPPTYAAPEPRDGRIMWMRDGVRFPVIHCKMTEATMQADCDSRGKVKPWRMVALEKLVPISPRNCMEVSTSRKVTLFNRTVALDTLE
jgi:hypothetical protein